MHHLDIFSTLLSGVMQVVQPAVLVGSEMATAEVTGFAVEVRAEVGAVVRYPPQ